MEILDSGNRREFETGAVRDMSEGKGRMDLLPWAAIMAVSKHCENGAKKYGEHNVDKGLPTHSFCDSASRHLAKYLDGWEDEPHLLAAAWNLLWAIQMEVKHPEMVDTPWEKKTEPTTKDEPIKKSTLLPKRLKLWLTPNKKCHHCCLRCEYFNECQEELK